MIARDALLLEVRPKAIHVMIGGQRRWVPMSVVHEDSEIYGVDTEGAQQKLNERGTLVVHRWWAEKEKITILD